jgi:hypothetical protein
VTPTHSPTLTGLEGGKPDSTGAAFPSPFPFPPPCPGADGNHEVEPTTSSTMIPTPSTPVRQEGKSRTQGSPFSTPQKKQKLQPKAHHLHGWDETSIPEWLTDVPTHLRRKLEWSKSYDTAIPDDAIVLLFVGQKDGGSLDEILARRHPHLKGKIFAIDLKRDKRFNDFLSKEPYNSLCTAASEGRVHMLGGGPMCRTWSVLRLLQLQSGNGMICRGTHRVLNYGPLNISHPPTKSTPKDET